MTPSRGQRPLAARLLEDVLVQRGWDTEALASALGLGANQLEAYRRGDARMPVEHQIQLATFVLGRIPEFTGTARHLISQANAEAAYLAKETVTHMAAPPGQFWR